ncbi:hypothetical protein LJC54_02405 [Parabacteroides sp. OttesenSCG-928-J18]|nr:hypothetical protein [Bacteroidales bacterium OttesenSCG-928-L03]MDL2244339.1 hypothetical protein [Parabacteroides sp. OttesenSCG-928-J18]MDL2255236.1 hypothetical protein [Parabacteroides sp. OttesenSCG-928-K15]
MRIAIIGPSKEKSRTISLKLSKALNLPHIGIDSNEIVFQHIYGKAERKNTSSERYTMALAKFHSRMKQEKQPSFVSDGSLIDDIVQLRLTEKTKTSPSSIYSRIISVTFRKEIKEFEKKVEKLICDYATKAYDILFLIKDSSATHGIYKAPIEEGFIELMKEKKMPYKIIIIEKDSAFDRVIDDIKLAIK